MLLEERTRYPKTLHLWKRFENPPAMRGVLDRNKLSAPEFRAIDNWHVTEKITGSNIRVTLRQVRTGVWGIDFFTREGTDQNIVWPGAKEFLTGTFTLPRIFEAIDVVKLEKDTVVVLYGEIFGPKIHGGGTYSPTVDYALFDVRIDDWWLEPKVVEKMAQQMGIRYVPVISENWELHEVITFLEAPDITSKISPEHVMEGVVCRSNPMMLFRGSKNPIQFKLKFKEMKKTLEWEAK